MEKNIKTIVVSGFPGVGKSYYVNQGEGSDYMPQRFAIDSDSSTFDKSNFPRNYIEHIKGNIGKVKIIFVSSHKEVRDALVEAKIDFTLAYPYVNLKDEYIERYKQRGSDDGFINFISDNWDKFILDLIHQKGCKHLVLKEKEFLYNTLRL
jgi:hypothetical protein